MTCENILDHITGIINSWLHIILLGSRLRGLLVLPEFILHALNFTDPAISALSD